MGLRTNPDRILENIDRQRIREEEAQAGQDRQAVGKELETEIPDVDATTPERMKRIFSIVERSYTKAASNVELGITLPRRGRHSCPPCARRCIHFHPVHRFRTAGRRRDGPVRDPPGTPHRGEEANQD